MVDFKKATRDAQYEAMRRNHPQEYEEIVAACSVLGYDVSEETPVSVKAQAEAYCMSLALRMFRKGRDQRG